MSFHQRFQLGGQIPGSLSSDYLLPGRQAGTGRLVTIHLLAGGFGAENEAVLRRIGALPPQYQVCFLETGEFNGSPYVITDVVKGNPPVRQWLASVEEKSAEAEAKRLSRVVAWHSPAKAAAEPEAAPVAAGDGAGVANVPVGELESGYPDEFTRMLESPVEAQRPAEMTPAAPVREPAEQGARRKKSKAGWWIVLGVVVLVMVWVLLFLLWHPK